MKPFLPLLAVALASALLPLVACAQTPATSVDLSQFQTADSLWLHIQDVRKGPKTRPATAEEYRAVMGGVTAQLAACTAEFLNRYPADPRKWDAMLIQIENAAAVNNLAGRPDETAHGDQLRQLAASLAAPNSVRAQARYDLLGISMRAYMTRAPSMTSDAILAQLHQFISDFPTYPSLDALKYTVAQTLGAHDPAAGDALLKELADSGEGTIPDQARKQLALREKLKSPIDLHFTAVDGSEVNLSQMRGKVVLIDFWATWCGPCRAELPNVIAAYKKLHSQGFEVVGISLDQDRNKLVSFTAQSGMPWPQYFDGKGWQNEISSGYAIQSIPAMWLVNKRGYVVTTNGRDDLEGQVEKMLGE